MKRIVRTLGFWQRWVFNVSPRRSDFMENKTNKSLTDPEISHVCVRTPDHPVLSSPLFFTEVGRSSKSRILFCFIRSWFSFQYNYNTLSAFSNIDGLFFNRRGVVNPTKFHEIFGTKRDHKIILQGKQTS